MMKWSTMMFILAAVFGGLTAFYVTRGSPQAVYTVVIGLLYVLAACTVRRGGL